MSKDKEERLNAMLNLPEKKDEDLIIDYDKTASEIIIGIMKEYECILDTKSVTLSWIWPNTIYFIVYGYIKMENNWCPSGLGYLANLYVTMDKPTKNKIVTIGYSASKPLGNMQRTFSTKGEFRAAIESLYMTYYEYMIDRPRIE